MANIINGSPVGYYSPPRKLKNSVASQPDNGGAASFPAESADIPDKFATTESPKLKFLFAVQFYPRTEDFFLDDNGSILMEELIFPLKKATRPNISLTYENVNQYNYRTNVLKKIEYSNTPATLTFYDDIPNRALNLIITYLNTVSPISKKTIQDAASLGSETTGSDGSGSTTGIINAAGPIAAIRVAHHSFNPDNPNQLQSVYYDYLNPKIISVNLDELDMASSDVTNVEFSFIYDSVNITTPTSNLPTGTVTVGDVQQVGNQPLPTGSNNTFTDTPSSNFSDTPPASTNDENT